MYIIKEPHRYWCPFCGLKIIADDERLKFHHELPLCAEWSAKLIEFGGKPDGVSVILDDGRKKGVR